jgi:UDP-N-acetylmuramoylalanine--D-glutamate ligase
MTLQDYIQTLIGKRVAVVGVGVSNLPLLRLLAEHGCDVPAHDRRSAEAMGEVYRELAARGVRFVLGEKYLEKLDYDVVFRTPGLHPDKLREAVRPDTVITSEMEAFFAVCPCRTVALTGSDGKTTTSTVIANLLEAAG